jgi:hypothetical protein
MPAPPVRQVVPHRKRLLEPLHNPRQLESALRLYVKHKPVVLQAQSAYLEIVAFRRPAQNPGKERLRLHQPEQLFPVDDDRADFVPHALSKFS